MTARPPKRREPPLSVKLEVALRALGLTEAQINWSHEPALGLRAINEAGTDYEPPQHDPGYLFIRLRPDHAHITFKDNGTGRSDITTIAKVKRLTKEQEDFRRKVLSRPCGQKRERTSKIRSRGFRKQSRPMRSTHEVRR